VTDLRLLEEAAAAARKGDALACVERLLDAWRETPAAAIADALDRVSKAAVDGVAPPSWEEAATSVDLLEAGRLVDRLREKNASEAAGLIGLLVSWPRDPRIAAGMRRLCADPPFHATGSRPFWRQVFALLVKHEDPRGLEELPRIAREVGRVINGATQREWMQNQLGKAAAKLAKVVVPKVKGAEAKLVASIELVGRVATKKRAAGASALELYQAVYDAPDDDGPRAVLADRLAERGDPRGELINLQLARKGRAATEEERKRERALIVKNQGAWLGPLAPVVQLKGASFTEVGPIVNWWHRPLHARWERGFLDGALVEFTGPQLAKLAPQAVWATVSQLSFGRRRKLPMAQVGELFGRLRGIRGIDVDAESFRVLCDSQARTRLEVLEVGDAGDAAWERIEGFPALKRVMIWGGSGQTYARGLASKMWTSGRLEELRVRTPGGLVSSITRRGDGLRLEIDYLPGIVPVKEIAGGLPIARVRSLEVHDYQPSAKKTAALREIFPHATEVVVRDLSAQ
jgi:uncharacterized protein (TIGR02996 family)